MTDIVSTIKMYRKQQQFVHCPARLSGFTGGRGSGKSWSGAYRLFRMAKPGGRYMVVAPTYDVLQTCTMESFFEIDNVLNFVKDYSASKRRAILGNGAKIFFRSGDHPNTLRGPNLWGCWLDEASYMDELVYNVMIGSLRAGGSVGPLWATFTPNGPSHWTYKIFGPGNKHGAILFRADTSENVFNPPDFANFLREQYTPLRARQEVGGEFIMIEGAEWPPEYLPESMFYKEIPKDVVMRFWVHSLDPSMGKDAKEGDYAALLRIGMDTRMHLWIDDAWLDIKPVDQIEDMGVAFMRDRPYDGFIIETNGFQELVARNILKKAPGAKIYTHTSTENKEVRIRMALTPLLAQQRIHLRDTVANRLGFTQMQEFPLPKTHDDFPDSLAIGTELINQLLGKIPPTPLRLQA